MITTSNHIPSPGVGMGAIRSRSLRNRHLFVLDVVSLILACVAAYSIRFEGLSWLDTVQRSVFLWYLALALPMRLALFWTLGLYRRYWSLASVAELERVLAGGRGGRRCVVPHRHRSPDGVSVHRRANAVVCIHH